MKHSVQILTFLSAQRLAYGSMSLEPAETRPRSNFPESRVAVPRYDQLSYNINAWHRQFYLAKPQVNNPSCGNYTITHFRGTEKTIHNQA